LAYCDAMRKEIAIMKNHLTGHLRLGAMPSMSPVLPWVLKTFRDRYPGVRVDVQFVGPEAMKLGLNNFALDVALTYLDKADLGRKNTLPIILNNLVFWYLIALLFKNARRSLGARPQNYLSPCYGRRCMNGVSSIRSFMALAARRKHGWSQSQFSI